MEPRIDAFLRSRVCVQFQPDTLYNYRKVIYYMTLSLFRSVKSEDLRPTRIANYMHTKLLHLYPLSCNKQHENDVFISMDRRELVKLRQRVETFEEEEADRLAQNDPLIEQGESDDESSDDENSSVHSTTSNDTCIC